MKTTVNLPDELVYEAKQVALRRRVTLRELVESGLRYEVKKRDNPALVHPLGSIQEVGAGHWDSGCTDEYVQSLRKGWE